MFVVLSCYQKFINHFLFFDYSCAHISENKENSWTFYSSIERTDLRVFHVSVKNIPLNVKKKNNSPGIIWTLLNIKFRRRQWDFKDWRKDIDRFLKHSFLLHWTTFTSYTLFTPAKHVLLNWFLLNENLKNLIFHRIQVLANLHFHCTKFK